MRLAPVALWALHDPIQAADLAETQSRTTHGALQAVEACRFFAMLLHEALHGADKAAVLAPRTWHGDPAIAAIAAGNWRGKPRSSIRSTGYVVDTLEAALWAVGSTDSLEAALVLAVNLGGDADTTGAVTGQLAGALHGASSIPERWLQPLAWRERITTTAIALIDRYEPPDPPGETPVRGPPTLPQQRPTMPVRTSRFDQMPEDITWILLVNDEGQPASTVPPNWRNRTGWLLTYTPWRDNREKGATIIVSRHVTYDDAWAALERLTLRPPYHEGPMHVWPDNVDVNDEQV